jgi:Restriction endonuclease
LVCIIIMNNLLHTIFLEHGDRNLWDTFEAECQKFYNEPAHSFTEMRMRDNKKVRGDIFEEFCVVYLKHIKNYDDVWLLADVPDTILDELGMKRPDMGIDIVCRRGRTYSAVQCKYKKQETKSKIVTWKALSTFYALCMRTGPWEKYIVMTNCSYVRHMGKKSNKDLSICLKTLQAITKDKWITMCGIEGHTLQADTTRPTPKTDDEVRLARLKFFGKI